MSEYFWTTLFRTPEMSFGAIKPKTAAIYNNSFTTLKKKLPKSIKVTPVDRDTQKRTTWARDAIIWKDRAAHGTFEGPIFQFILNSAINQSPAYLIGAWVVWIHSGVATRGIGGSLGPPVWTPTNVQTLLRLAQNRWNVCCWYKGGVTCCTW